MSTKHPAPWKWEDHMDKQLQDANGVELLSARLLESEPTDPCVAEMIRAAPEMEALLRNHEWIFDGQNDGRFCPECGNHKKTGHHPTCDLAAALSRIDKARESGLLTSADKAFADALEKRPGALTGQERAAALEAAALAAADKAREGT